MTLALRSKLIFGTLVSVLGPRPKQTLAMGFLVHFSFSKKSSLLTYLPLNKPVFKTQLLFSIGSNTPSFGWLVES